MDKVERILVFGANGFIAKSFVNILTSSLKAEIGLFDIDPNIKSVPAAYHAVGNATNPEDIKSCINEFQPSRIINFIGIMRHPDFAQMFAVNVLPSKTILEYLKSNMQDDISLTLVGSAAEYGNPAELPLTEESPLNPVNEYGLSKVFQTNLAFFYHRNFKVNVRVARIFNVEGKGAPKILATGNWRAQIETSDSPVLLKVGNLSPKRDFLAVEDVSRDLITVMFSGKPGNVYNICSGLPVKMEKVLTDLLHEYQKEAKIEVDPSLFKADEIDEIYGSRFKLDKLSRPL